MKKQLTRLTFFLIAVVACGLSALFVSPVGAQVRGTCAAAPCDCRSVGGRFHFTESRWCNYQLCYNQCMSEAHGGRSQVVPSLWARR